MKKGTGYLLSCCITLFSLACSKPTEFKSKAIDLNNKAVACMMRFHTDSAMILLNQAIEVDSTYYMPHISKANIYLQKHDLNRALYEFEISIRLKPDYAEGYQLAGMIHDLQADTAQAHSCYQKSISLYNNKIASSPKKEKIIAYKLNRAVSYILIGNAHFAKDELKKLKVDFPQMIVIDSLMKKNKQSILKDIDNAGGGLF